VLCAAAAWGLTLAAVRIVSVASLVAALLLPAALMALGAPRPYWLSGFALVALIIWRHRGNIERLIRRKGA
jgi:glycerol-3-phosphate acyltransferase PlsY